MSERIQPENNRTFTTGSGDWVGDLIWHGDTYEGHQGYISVPVEGTATPKTISLQYPAIKPVPGKDFTLRTYPHYLEYAGSGFTLGWQITDGVYTFSQHLEHFFDGFPWDQIAIVDTMPNDWTPESTTLSLTIGVIEDAPAELVFDHFSFETEAPARTDHLPLMGVH